MEQRDPTSFGGPHGDESGGDVRDWAEGTDFTLSDSNRFPETGLERSHWSFSQVGEVQCPSSS